MVPTGELFASPPGGDGLKRSIELFRSFLHEQSNPEHFYELLARDSVRMVAEHCSLIDRTVLDVGAGPRQFGESFLEAGARYIALDHDIEALDPLGLAGSGGIAGSGEELPVRSASLDITFSSNVVEHVPNPERLLNEMVRVTRPGGLIVAAYTNWLSPWGGHETSPFHYLGGDRAVARYRVKHGHPPKNLIGRTLYRTSVQQGLTWARRVSNAELLDARPRYYPGWARGILRVPAVREVLTWNLWLVLRRL